MIHVVRSCKMEKSKREGKAFFCFCLSVPTAPLPLLLRLRLNCAFLNFYLFTAGST